MFVRLRSCKTTYCTRKIQMETLNIFISLFIEYKRYIMALFFYVVSSACNTSIPGFRKCMDASIKKFFWLRAQRLLHRLLDLFVGPERLASHRLFERPKHMKITGGEVWRLWRMWKTLGQILDCCNS